MNININSMSAYSTVLTATTRPKGEAVGADAKAGDSPKVNADMSGTAVQSGPPAAAEPTTIKEQIVDQLKEQIERVQKQLQQQQQQLAAAQNSKGSEQEKAQRIMAIQQQISGTMAQLTALQGALMQAMSVSVDTTA